VVRLLADVPLAAKHREQAQDDALVGDAIEVVELGLDVVLRPPPVGFVGANPLHRFGAPLCPADEIARLPVEAAPRTGVLLRAQAEHPDAAKRVVEECRAVACPARVSGLLPI